MSRPDLARMDIDELKRLQKDVATAIATYQDRQREEARALLEKQAREMGFKLEELAGPASRRKSRGSPPKYRHPENPALTWTGRGRRPNWIAAALDEGRRLEDMQA